MSDNPTCDKEETTGQHRKPKSSADLDLLRYKLAQVLDSLSELNIHGTCEERGCSREEALAHPDWLMDHYNNFGGTEAFAKFRSKFISFCEYVEVCRFGEDCELALVKSKYEKCPLRKMGEHCICQCNSPCIRTEAELIVDTLESLLG